MLQALIPVVPIVPIVSHYPHIPFLFYQKHQRGRVNKLRRILAPIGGWPRFGWLWRREGRRAGNMGECREQGGATQMRRRQTPEEHQEACFLTHAAPWRPRTSTRRVGEGHTKAFSRGIHSCGDIGTYTLQHALHRLGHGGHGGMPSNHLATRSTYLSPVHFILMERISIFDPVRRGRPHDVLLDRIRPLPLMESCRVSEGCGLI